MATAIKVFKQRVEKSIYVELAGAAEDDPSHQFDVAVTITKVRTICRGTTPSVTWSLRHDPDRNAAGTLVASGTSTSVTTGESAAVSVAIPAGNHIWLETSAQTGTVLSFRATFIGVED